MYPISGLTRAFNGDLAGDIDFVVTSVVLIVTYLLTFLGSCSPIHCRVMLTLTATFCITLSYVAGFGFCFVFKYQVTQMHNLIPFLLLGIGVDDMFVMCNAVDQTPLSWSP